MVDNISDYIIALCGEFNDGYKPMSRSEFWKFFHKYGNSVENLVASGEQRVVELLKRFGAMIFSLEKLRQQGFFLTTFNAPDFPERLRLKLGDFCPPLLYGCGNSELNKKRTVGYVGSRTVSEADKEWTKDRVATNVDDLYGIVTGGARGVDNEALEQAIFSGGFAVLFLPDNISAKTRERFIMENVLNGNLLVYSHVSPLSPKSRNSFVAAAMERNKFIYAQSAATVVVRSDLGKGGTWSGASEALKHDWAKVFVWDNKSYPGNQELIRLGGIPLSESGEIVKKEPDGSDSNNKSDEKADTVNENNIRDVKQLSIFDIADVTKVDA